jgi:carboxylate-amine ligase
MRKRGDAVRTIGVEEELLLVDPRSGRPLPLASAALAGEAVTDKAGEAGGSSESGGTVGLELQQQQLEIDTRPRERLSEIARDLRSTRDRADHMAMATGSRAVALATSPLPVRPRTTPKTRYLEMTKLFGITAQEQLTCGCHVHVSIESAAEAVGVLDRIRTWLPIFTALSANSPYWQGKDSGYASFRAQAWGRWPSAGPIEVQDTEDRYRALVAGLVSTGAVMDEGMIYFDARLSARYSTVEVRVADVCLRVDDAVVLAGLIRALVDTAAREWRDGIPAPTVPAILLRAQAWQASRSGLQGDLVHPLDGLQHPAADVIWDLHAHVRRALEDSGDEKVVREGIARLLSTGNGADRQRFVHGRTGSLWAVVSDAVNLTQA